MHNSAAVFTTDALTRTHPGLVTAQRLWSRLEAQDCRSNWFNGLVQQRLGYMDSGGAFRQLASCAPDFIPMIAKMAPEDQELAEFAVQMHPEAADAWFWLAQTQVRQEPQSAIQSYQKGLELRPRDSLRQRELGDLLRAVDPQAAIQAYLQSCRYGDVGLNGCWRAGLTAEALGECESADRYYRRSKWKQALQRAEEIEKHQRCPH